MTATATIDPGGRTPVCISVQDLWVTYRLRPVADRSARDLLSPRQWVRRYEEVTAVRGVTFDVHEGEVLGVLGANGSGKSTLLRAVAGLQTPTSGRVLVSSQPALLGVGATLKPDLSGRRNIVIGGLALGLNLQQARDLVLEVIEFSELGEAIDRPMRTYSSGMRARLAFAIAALSSPEILLIDEALAVGDRRFRRKSLAKVRELQQTARAIVMVTHNLNEIETTCNRAIWMVDGLIEQDGDVSSVVAAYEESQDTPARRVRTAQPGSRPERRARRAR